MMDLVVKSFKKMGRSSNRGKFSRKIPNSDRDRYKKKEIKDTDSEKRKLSILYIIGYIQSTMR